MSLEKLIHSLQSLPEQADRVDVLFHLPAVLLEALGLHQHIMISQFPTGNEEKMVDFALFKPQDIPSNTRNSSPFILMDFYSNKTDFNHAQSHKNAVANITSDLLAPKCKSVAWGIICNGKQIQLLRKHGKVVYPMCPILSLNHSSPETIQNSIDTIRGYIEAKPPGLTVSIYNNKGGVGKTTTTINLAAILAWFNYKVLAIDFDCNQQDLTTSLGFHPVNGPLYECLNSKNSSLASVITTYKKISTSHDGSKSRTLSFDVVPSDQKLLSDSGVDFKRIVSANKLSQLLEPMKQIYDYILIDTPPTWTFFSQSSLIAADVVLIPTQHDNLKSLKNAIVVIKDRITEIREQRKDIKPIALPIFFNSGKITDTQLQLVYDEIDNSIAKYAEYDIDLQPYFYPKYTHLNKDRTIFHLPDDALVSRASFKRTPAAYLYKYAHESYQKLAREYFVQ